MSIHFATIVNVLNRFEVVSTTVIFVEQVKLQIIASNLKHLPKNKENYV